MLPRGRRVAAAVGRRQPGEEVEEVQLWQCVAGLCVGGAGEAVEVVAQRCKGDRVGCPCFWVLGDAIRVQLEEQALELGLEVWVIEACCSGARGREGLASVAET